MLCFSPIPVGPLSSSFVRWNLRLRVWLPAAMAGVVLCGAGSLGQAQPREKARVPQAEAPLMPVLGVGEEPAVEVKTSAARSARLLPWVEMLGSGDKTAAQVWESGKFSVEDVLFALEHLITSNGVVVGRKGSPLVKQQGETARAALAGLLAEHGGERLKEWEEKPESLAVRVRLWLGEHYGKQGDERAVPLLESVLAYGQKQAQAMPEKKLKNAPATYFAAAERLAWFYRDKGKPEEAAKAWLRVPELLNESDWWVGDAQVEAAWVYTRVDENKAEQSYRKAAQHNFPWAKQAALWGLARLLIKQDRHEEAHKFLASQLQGEAIPQKQVIVSCLLGSSYYRSGDFRSAQEWSKKALAQYAALSEVKPRMGLDAAVSESSERLWWSEHWKVSPFVCWPPQLNISAQEKSTVNIRAFRDLQVNLSVDDPRIRAAFKDGWQSAENGLCFDRQVTIELLPIGVQDRFSGTLTVTSPQFPGLEQKVRLHINQASSLNNGGDR